MITSIRFLYLQLCFTSLFFFLGFIFPLLKHTKEKNTKKETDDLPFEVRFSLLAAFLGSTLNILVSVTYFGYWLNNNGKIVAPVLGPFHWMPYLPPLQWEARLDGLSAFFCLLIGFFAAGVAIYSFGALKAIHYRKQSRSIVSAFNVFVWATLMAVLANDVFTLIAALEFMTLSFGFLSLYKHKLYMDDDNKHSQEQLKNARLAPQIYMIISHASTAFLLLALTFLAIQADSLSLDVIRANHPGKNLSSIIFILAFLGLGIRAGLTPAHIWVSLVHPNSPTTTHAFSLGIAIKVAIYLMYRFFFEFLTPQPEWGYLILFVAVITALVNVWYAIASHDLKTALAYHSIENVGIIVAGIGISVIFSSTANLRWLSSLALIASFYHLMNHAIFKGLLYLGTGAIDNLTSQTVEFDKLGGLIKLYPMTSILFLIGSYSIAGFPPLNGFISEYLTLFSVYKGLYFLRPGELGGTGSILSSFLFIIALIMLVASFVMTAICFYKIVGISFLGDPRTDKFIRDSNWSPAGKDVPVSMQFVMVVFASFCIILGIFPRFFINTLIFPIYAVDQASFHLLLPNFPIDQASFNLIWSKVELPMVSGFVFVGGGTVFIVYISIWLINKLFSNFPVREVDDQVNCGTSYRPSMQVSSEQLVFLIQDAFKFFGLPRGNLVIQNREIMSLSDEKVVRQYLPSVLSDKVVERFNLFYNRAWEITRKWSTMIGCWIHTGDIRRSLLYILLTNIIILFIFLLFKDGV